MKQESQSLDNNPTKERKLAKSKEGIKTQENEARFIGKFLKSQENINLEISKLETTIRNIFAIFSTEIDEKNLLCSLPDIKKHLEDLKLNSNKDINLFIEQASLILCSLKKLKESTEIILKGDPQTQINKEKIEKIEEEIESLHNYNFFSKIIKSADSKIKKLEFDKQQLIETNEKAKSKYKDNFNNNFGIDSIRHQIEDTISDVAKKEIIEMSRKKYTISAEAAKELMQREESKIMRSSHEKSIIEGKGKGPASAEAPAGKPEVKPEEPLI